MRYTFSLLTVVALSLVSLSTTAKVIDNNSAPKKVMEAFYKRHPNALEVNVAQDKHFNQELTEVFYKENKEDTEKQIELYRANGHLFVNAMHTQFSETSDLMPKVVKDNLKTAFGDYHISGAVLISNPNGVGEEYDLLISSESKAWHVVIDTKGNITAKEPN